MDINLNIDIDVDRYKYIIKCIVCFLINFEKIDQIMNSYEGNYLGKI